MSKLIPAALLLALSTAYAQPPKKRVAVFDFDYATVQSGVSAIFGQNVDIGKGIADLIVDRLVNDGTYSVIERKAISKIMAEQNFSNSDRADDKSAAKLGKILGVDAIIIGSITQFGRDDKTIGVGGGAFGGLAGRYGVGNVGKKQSKAVVAISARMVSTDTAEILASSTGKGESQRSGAMLGGAGGSYGNGGGGAVNMSSSNFANTILGEAVASAVTQLCSQLDANAGRLPTKVIAIDGLVADVSGNTLIMNVGSRAGVKVGDRLQIKRTGRAITDPATGKVLRRAETPLGEVVIKEVDEVSSTGDFRGTGQVKVGDAAKSGAQ
jgi:curli biogenesis system outer membrane secretion channel CsgG